MSEPNSSEPDLGSPMSNQFCHDVDAEKELYEKNGYLHLANIFTSAEIEECAKAYDELFELKKQEQYNMEATWGGNWRDKQGAGDGKTSVLSIHNLQCHNAIFTKMLLKDSLLDVVSNVTGSPNILLHHTKAHVKPPEIGSSFPAHQDYHYFPFKNHTMTAIFIHLDDCDEHNGGLVVFPGSHKLGPLPNHSDSPGHNYVDQDAFRMENGTLVHAKKGDVVIFSYLLVHGSRPNTSNRNRRMLLFQMMAAEDEPLTQAHISPCHGMVLRGRNVKIDADIKKRYLNAS